MHDEPQGAAARLAGSPVHAPTQLSVAVNGTARSEEAPVRLGVGGISGADSKTRFLGHASSVAVGHLHVRSSHQFHLLTIKSPSFFCDKDRSKDEMR